MLLLKLLRYIISATALCKKTMTDRPQFVLNWTLEWQQRYDVTLTVDVVAFTLDIFVADIMYLNHLSNHIAKGYIICYNYILFINVLDHHNPEKRYYGAYTQAGLPYHFVALVAQRY